MTQLTAKPFTARPLAARPFTAYPFGESTSVSNPLVWLAAYPDSSGVMQAQVTGEGTPSFTVDDGLLLPDHEGIYRTTAEDTPPWHGARKVTNLLSYSEDFSNAVWEITNSSGNASVTPVSGIGPNGEDGFEVTLDGSGDYLTTDYYSQVIGSDYVIRTLVRAKSGSASFAPRVAGSTNVAITLSEAWQVISSSRTASGTATKKWGFRGDTGEQTFYVINFQAENVTGQTNQNPSEYVPTTSAAASTYLSYANGNTVADNVVVPAKGATLDPLPSLYGAPSYTNSLTYSNDLTQWTQTNSPTVALDANGLTGAPSTASTATDPAANASQITQSVSLTANTATHTYRIFVEKDTDETRYPEFLLYFSSGASGVLQLNTKTGVHYDRGSAGTVTKEVNSVGNWWEVLISVANNSQPNATCYVRPAATTTPGAYETAATGSIVVGNVELHLNKTIAQVRGSSPIVTAASTVTTSAISMSYDIANHSDTQGAYYAEVVASLAATNDQYGQIIGTHGTQMFNIMTRNNASTHVSSYDGTTSIFCSGLVFSGATNKVGMAYSASDSLRTGNVNGTVTADQAYDGVWNMSSQTALTVGTPTNSPIWISNIRRYSLSYTAAKAKIDELMT